MRKLIPLSLCVLLSAGLCLTSAPARAGELLAVTETPTPTFTPTATATPTPTATLVPTSAPPAAPLVLDPAITKSGDPAFAAVGDRVTFTITVVNPNDVPLPAVTVTDPLPAQLDFLDGTTTSGALTYDAAARAVVVVTAPLAARQEVVIVIQTRVNALGQPPDTTTNIATLSRTSAAGLGLTVQSDAALVQFVPASLPDTGYGPGPRERVLLAGAAGLAAAAVLGLSLGWVWRRRRHG
jgi:uncharacterized repeat protein (TIGR01451 family)